MKFLTALAASAAIAVTSSALAADRQVNIYNWSDYIDPGVLEDFTSETGIEVVYDTYDSNKLMEAKVLAGDSGYDIIPPASYSTGRLGEAGAIRELDRSKLTNYGNLWAELLGKMEAFDEGNKLVVPYNFWTFGIVVNEDKVAAALGADYPRSWGLLFDPKYASQLQGCGMQLVDSATDFIPIAAMYKGYNPNTDDPDEIQEAIDLLVSTRENVGKIATDGLISNMANGDICFGVTWSGDALIAKERALEAGNGVNIDYFIPEEGTNFDFDGFAILADAPNEDEAYEFLDYMMRADVAAKNANYIRYGTGNQAALPMVDPVLRDNKGVYPDDATLAKMFTFAVPSLKKDRLFTRGWTKVMTGE